MTLQELIAQYSSAAPQSIDMRALIDPYSGNQMTWGSRPVYGTGTPMLDAGALQGTMNSQGGYDVVLSQLDGLIANPETGRLGGVAGSFDPSGQFTGANWFDQPERSGLGDALLKHGWAIPLAAAGTGFFGIDSLMSGAAAPISASAPSWTAPSGVEVSAVAAPSAVATPLAAAGAPAAGAGGLAAAAPISASVPSWVAPAAAGTGGAGAGGGLLGSLLGAGSSWLAPALGAAAGLAASGEQTSGQTLMRQLDPDVRQLYFGEGGLIPTAQGLYAANPSGMNPMRSDALGNLASYINSDAYLAPYQQQAALANQMLSAFSAPAAAPAARAPAQGWGYDPSSLLMPRV